MPTAEHSLVREIILWKPLYLVSVGGVLLVLLAAPINAGVAMIILFSIISLWSRIPGMAVPVLRELDMIDFFMLVIGVNIGGPAAAAFGVANLWFSRIFGPFENLHYVGRDTFAFIIGGLTLPMFYALTGSLLWTILIFVTIRHAVRFAQIALLDRDCFAEEFGVILASIPLGYITNAIYVGAIGTFVLGLVASGLALSAELLLFTVGTLAMIAGIKRGVERYRSRLEKPKTHSQSQDHPAQTHADMPTALPPKLERAKE